MSYLNVNVFKSARGRLELNENEISIVLLDVSLRLICVNVCYEPDVVL